MSLHNQVINILNQEKDFLINYKFTNEEILDFRIEAQKKAENKTRIEKVKVEWEWNSKLERKETKNKSF